MTLRVACLGDSITRGQLSFDYVKLLLQRHEPGAITVARFGINGDFAYNLLERLELVVTQPFDVITVLIGTNDARASLEGFPLERVMRRKRLPTRPDAAWFQECLSAIVERLRKRAGVKIGLLSLPVLGQDLDAAPARASESLSRRIAEVAAAHEVAYLPLHEAQVETLRRMRATPLPYRELTTSAAVSTILERALLRRSLDAIAQRQGLVLTVDHIHQNSRGAAQIADVIAQSELLGTPGQPE